MVIIFNLIGAGILILAFAVGAGVGLLFGAKTESPMYFVGGLLTLVLDLAYRMDKGEGSLLHPRRGGHVFFIPAWVLGLGFFMTGVLTFVLPEHGRELSREYRPQVQPESRGRHPELLAGHQPPPAQPRPSPAELKLTMISGTGQRRLATINGELFARGETHHVKVAQRNLTVACLEIRAQSVLVNVTGRSHPVELKFGEPVALEPSN